MLPPTPQTDINTKLQGAHEVSWSHAGPWIPTAFRRPLINPISGFRSHAKTTDVATVGITEGMNRIVRKRLTPRVFTLRRSASATPATIPRGTHVAAYRRVTH